MSVIAIVTACPERSRLERRPKPERGHVDGRYPSSSDVGCQWFRLCRKIGSSARPGTSNSCPGSKHTTSSKYLLIALHGGCLCRAVGGEVTSTTAERAAGQYVLLCVIFNQCFARWRHMLTFEKKTPVRERSISGYGSGVSALEVRVRDWRLRVSSFAQHAEHRYIRQRRLYV